MTYAPTNIRERKIDRNFIVGGDRYAFDFDACSARNGWSQLDTTQDASYYGNWVNPTKMMLFSFCEGDTTLTTCPDEADFVAAVRECVSWHKEHGYFLHIDAMCDDTMITAFTRLGLAEYLG